MFLFCSNKSHFDLAEEEKRGLERGVNSIGHNSSLLTRLILTDQDNPCELETLNNFWNTKFSVVQHKRKLKRHF